MNLKRCLNGHYYDSDKYAQCPRCGSRDTAQPAAKPAQAPAKPAVSAPEKPQPKKWLTGWLVCIEGELAGMVYELKKGTTTIGGTGGQDICLEEDRQVARTCQAVIEYHPDTRSFTASAGESRELSYVNGQVILFDTELHSRDILQIGGERLMLVPLCGEDFAWDEAEGQE